MAAALRFAARTICRRALQGPQAKHLSTAAEAAIKQGRQRLSSHGGTSLRRFTSAESTTLVSNSNKVISNTAQPAEGLGKQIESTKHELIKLLGQMEAESSMGAEHKELLQVLKINNNRFLAEVYRGTVITGIGTMIAGIATAIVATEVVFRRRRQEDY